VGSYVYEQRGEQVFAETYLSMDGTMTAHRECSFTADKTAVGLLLATGGAERSGAAPVEARP
jgi:hypothetical protein